MVKLVRHRLAACKTVREGDEVSELPGGLWKVSPTRDVSPSGFVHRGHLCAVCELYGNFLCHCFTNNIEAGSI